MLNWGKMGRISTVLPPINSFRNEYRFLSNFYLHTIVYEDITYPSSEHAYQAAKTLDIKIRQQIATMKVGESKKFGQSIKLRSNWDKIKINIMHDLLELKFADKTLREQLLATKDAYLEEGNTWNDHFWGVCNGIGRNELGKALMRIRYKIISL